VDKAKRVLDIAGLCKTIAKHAAWKAPDKYDAGARDVAINLEQLPFVQVFTAEAKEEEGSRGVTAEMMVAGRPVLKLRHGRTMQLDRVANRFAPLVQEDED
jgi:hypothetical protein